MASHAEIARKVSCTHAEIARKVACTHAEIAKRVACTHAEIAKTVACTHAGIAKRVACTHAEIAHLNTDDFLYQTSHNYLFIYCSTIISCFERFLSRSMFI